MRPVRVTFVVDAPYAGGAERTVELLARGLRERGHRVAVVARAPDARSTMREWIDAMRANGFFVDEVRMRLPRHPLDAVGIVRAIRRQSPDVVHVNVPGPYDGQMGLVAPLARVAGARAVVTTEHLPMVERLWKRALVKRMCTPWIDRVITVARANVRWVTTRQHIPRARVRVVPNALPVDFGADETARRAVRARYGLRDDDIAVAYVGSLEPRKRPADALRALAHIEWERVRMLVVGDGPCAADVRDEVARLGLEGRVVFAGRVGAGEMAAHHAAADVLVLPSEQEGMPYVILEAMACARPVVATRVFGIPEQVLDGRTGLLVEPGDVDGLAFALGRLVNDGALRERMGRAARQRFLAEFTLDRQVERVEGVYAEVLRTHGEGSAP